MSIPHTAEARKPRSARKPAQSSRLPMGPHTEFLRKWIEIRSNTPDGARAEAKAQRKIALNRLVEDNVTPAECTRATRYDSAMYDPPKYRAKVDGGKQFGRALSAAIRGEVAELAAVYAPPAGESGDAPHDNPQRALIIRKVPGEALSPYFFCDVCGKLELRTEDTAVSVHNESVICTECVSNGRVRRSTLMGDWLLATDAEAGAAARGDIDNRRHVFASRLWYTENGWVFVSSWGVWVPPSLADELGVSADGSELIGEYHSSKRIVGKIPSAYDKRKLPLLMGLELEMEVVSGSRSQVALQFHRLMSTVKVNGRSHRYCALERDGSLSSGFEMVTGYTGLDTHAVALARLKSMPFAGKLASHDTTTCGLHVHIDRNNITPLHADKLGLLINDPQNRPLVLAVARRYNSGNYAKCIDKTGAGKSMGAYTRDVKRGLGVRQDRNFSGKVPMAAMRKSYRDIIAQGAGNADRYHAVNFTPQRTIEFRVYRGTLKYETIMSCLEFTRAAWLFSQEFSKAEMTTPKFLEFICRADNRPDTPHLRPYLQAKGFLPKERSDTTIAPARATQETVLQAEDATWGLPAPVVNPKRQAVAIAA